MSVKSRIMSMGKTLLEACQLRPVASDAGPGNECNAWGDRSLDPERAHNALEPMDDTMWADTQHPQPS